MVSALKALRIQLNYCFPPFVLAFLALALRGFMWELILCDKYCLIRLLPFFIKNTYIRAGVSKLIYCCYALIMIFSDSSIETKFIYGTKIAINSTSK